jgi:hypothetical protein
MREPFILIAHLLVTLAKLGTRGGLGAVAAESLAVKHQLLIMKRAQCRAPNLKAPAPRTQRSVKRTHWRGYRDEAAKSPLRLPQDCRANIESIRCRDQ